MKELDEKLKALFLAGIKGDKTSYQLALKEVSKLMGGYLGKAVNPRFRSRQQVEDLVQDVLIAVHNKRDLFDREKPFLPWVYAIARYRLIDCLRAEKRRPECVEWLEKFEAQLVVDAPQLSEESDGLDLLTCLNEKQREVLRLAKIEELSINEIAHKMDMTVSSVKVTIHRSLKAIRKHIGERG